MLILHYHLFEFQMVWMKYIQVIQLCYTHIIQIIPLMSKFTAAVRIEIYKTTQKGPDIW